MENAGIDFDWNQVRAFMATAEAGSFSAAARQLRLAQPTLGRQVAGLEQSLGVTLFERVGRSLQLTQAGQRLLEHVRDMGAAAERIALTASHQSQAAEGLVRITASDIYAAYILPSVLERLRERAPGIRVDVLASNTVNDLLRREADIALRHVMPKEPDLIARRCPDTVAQLYGASEYLDRLGRPGRAADLAGAAFIGPSERIEDFIAELNRRGVPVGPANFHHTTGSGLAAWEWVGRGLGIGAMVDEVARLTPGVEVVGDMAPIPVPLWLATHRELRTSRRIRVVFDVLAECLGAGGPGLDD